MENGLLVMQIEAVKLAVSALIATHPNPQSLCDLLRRLRDQAAEVAPIEHREFFVAQVEDFVEVATRAS